MSVKKVIDECVKALNEERGRLVTRLAEIDDDLRAWAEALTKIDAAPKAPTLFDRVIEKAPDVRPATKPARARGRHAGPFTRKFGRGALLSYVLQAFAATPNGTAMTVEEVRAAILVLNPDARGMLSDAEVRNAMIARAKDRVDPRRPHIVKKALFETKDGVWFERTAAPYVAREDDPKDKERVA